MKKKFSFLFFLIAVLGASEVRAQINAHELYRSAWKKDSLKDYDGALNDLNNAIAANNTNDSLHFLHAKVEAEKNHAKDAYAEINDVIKHNHTYFDAYLLRGVLKAKLGNYEGAVADFNKCIKLNPNNAKSYYNRGLAHAYLDEFKQAIADFTKATDLEPNYAIAWFQRGYWKEIGGDLQGSLNDLKKAKELSPNDKQLYIELAVTNYRLDNKKEACDLLNEAKNMGSSEAEEMIHIMCK